jgi:hypothetical protein
MAPSGLALPIVVTVLWIATFQRPPAFGGLLQPRVWLRGPISKVNKEEFMLRIAIIIGSTRPGRLARPWVNGFAKSRQRTDAEFEPVDIKDFNPLLDEPVSPIMGNTGLTPKYELARSALRRLWFVTPGHGISALQARSFLFREWERQGNWLRRLQPGARGQQLRLVLAEV